MLARTSVKRPLQATEEGTAVLLPDSLQIQTDPTLTHRYSMFHGQRFRTGHPAYPTGVLTAGAVISSLAARPKHALCGKRKEQAKDQFPLVYQVRMNNLATHVSNVFFHLLVKLTNCYHCAS